MTKRRTDFFVSPGALRLSVALTLLIAFIGCGGSRTMPSPQIYGSKPAEKKEKPTTTGQAAGTKVDSNQALSELPVKREGARPVTPGVHERESVYAKDTIFDAYGALEFDAEAENDYYESLQDTGQAEAVDDEIWRQFDLIDEYHAMGVIANRQASWQEATYYFEKALTLLGDLDIETDSATTPEATRYNQLIENVISDYKVSLRSLGHISDESSSSVLLDRFEALQERLKSDAISIANTPDTGEVTYDLPIVMNDRVKRSIVYFQTAARDAFIRYLSRKSKYEPMMREIIRQYDMPEDLIYLSLVESGYNPHAYSWARAMGLWQFIASTGRLYKLDRNWWIDERKDPVKSTHAAMQFLKELYQQFGDWELAMAAYNGGPGRVSRTIKSQNTRDFWKMRLRKQTMDYVPLIMAATIIGKNPKKYGFDHIDPMPEITWDEVLVNKPLELTTVASELNISVESLVELNPELLRKVTPPGYKDYVLKVPRGYKDRFYAAYDLMESPASASWVSHRIKRGETLSSIANKYGVSAYAIQEANNLKKGYRIYAGKELVIPVPLDRATRSMDKKEYAARNALYTVRKGDNLSEIAGGFGTSVGELRKLNYLSVNDRIYVGQKLKIPGEGVVASKTKTDKSRKTEKSAPTAERSSESSTHTVKSGESLTVIARKYGTSASQIRKWNNLGKSSKIVAGQVLRVSGESTGEYVVHKIRRGENLSSIAKQYGTSIEKILSANNIKNANRLMTGQRLTIYLE